MEAAFGAKASPIFRERLLPSYMRTDHYIPSSNLADADDEDPVSIKARELEYTEWRHDRRDFNLSKAQMVSVFMTGTLSQSSLDRIKDTRESDMDAAIKDSDILLVYKIVWDCHQYRGKTFKVADQQRVQKEFTMFGFHEGESLPSLKRRLSELLERMKNYEVSPDNFQIMYTFLMSAARYPSSHVQDICVDYLKFVDDADKFPKDLNEVYEEMNSITDVVNQVTNRHRVKQSHEGSVHQTSSRNNNNSRKQPEKNRRDFNSNKGFQSKGAVNSAYSNINKSVKTKLQTQSLNGKPKNINTERQYQEEKKRDPNLTFRAYLDKLTPCKRCGRRWHLESDCRKQVDGSNSKPKFNGQKKTFRKKFTKGKVNNMVGNYFGEDIDTKVRSPNFYDNDDADQDWIGSVFCAISRSDPYQNFIDFEELDPFEDNLFNFNKSYSLDKVVFGSDEEIEAYLSDCHTTSTKSYEEISLELDELLADQSYIRSNEDSLSDVSYTYSEEDSLSEVDGAVFMSEGNEVTNEETKSTEVVISEEQLALVRDFNIRDPMFTSFPMETEVIRMIRHINERFHPLRDEFQFRNELRGYVDRNYLGQVVDTMIPTAVVSDIPVADTHLPDPSITTHQAYVIREDLPFQAYDVEGAYLNARLPQDLISGDSEVPDPAIGPDDEDEDDRSDGHDPVRNNDGAPDGDDDDDDSSSEDDSSASNNSAESEEVEDLTYEEGYLTSEEYFTGALPSLTTPRQRVEQEFMYWIEYILYSSGRVSDNPFNFNVTRLEIYDTARFNNVTLRKTGLYYRKVAGERAGHVDEQEHLIYLGDNVFQFIYYMSEFIIPRCHVTRQMYSDIIGVSDESTRAHLFIQLEYLNNTWTYFDMKMHSKIFEIQGFVRHIIGEEIDIRNFSPKNFSKRLRTYMNDQNHDPKRRSLQSWLNTICGIVSQLHRYRDEEYLDKAFHCIVVFAAKARLTSRAGITDRPKAYARFQVDVFTVNGISSIDGDISVKRKLWDKFHRTNLSYKIRLNERSSIFLSGVHDLIICDRANQHNDVLRGIPRGRPKVLFDSTPGSINPIDYISLGPDPSRACAITDLRLHGITDAMRRGFYTAEMSIENIRSRPSTVFKGSIITPGTMYYNIVIADIDESVTDGEPDDRDVLFLLISLDTLQFEFPRENEKYPAGFMRFLMLKNADGTYNYCGIQRINGRMTPRSDPSVYLHTYDVEMDDFVMIRACGFEEGLRELDQESEIFMANGNENIPNPEMICPDMRFIDIDSEIRGVRSRERVRRPDNAPTGFRYWIINEQEDPPRDMLIMGNVWGRYDRSIPHKLTSRIYILMEDVHQWRQFQIAQNDNSHWGVVNHDRYVHQYETYFRDLLEDTRYPGYAIVCNPARHQLARTHVASMQESQYALITNGPTVSFTRDHVRETRERNDMYYRLIPNAIIRACGFNDNIAQGAIARLQSRMDYHEAFMVHHHFDREEYRERFQSYIIANGGNCPNIHDYNPRNYPPIDIIFNQDDEDGVDLQEVMVFVAEADVPDNDVRPPDDPSSGSSSAIQANNAVYVLSSKYKTVTKLSKFNNHTFIALDTMANVNVFRNEDLVKDVRTTQNMMNIDGVGEKGTRTQRKGVHPLFGEVWILPTNSYNIVSQYQAQKNGFLLRMSEDNNSCWLVNKKSNISVYFERDPSDHFYKCEIPKEAMKSKAFLLSAVENKSAVFAMDNQSMYYTQEQLRKAEIVEGMHVAMEHPSDQQLTAFLLSPSSINMPVTVQDLHNLRAIKGPCNVCLEGKPRPNKGSHPGRDPGSEPTQPGEELHCDIVFVQRTPRLFTVDDITGYMTFTLMPSKHATDVLDAFDTVINAYKSYLKVVRFISCDHESVLKSLESELNKRGVRMRIRLPYEHEKKAERAMRVVRERMRVKLRELPYKLPKKLYDSLASECIRNINMMPNYKSMPHSPVELVKGDKTNYLTDISPPFGSLVLCPTYDNQHSSGTEAKQEIAIALGPTGTNMKGGVLVYIPGRDRPLVRRNVKSLPMTANIIEHMNSWADQLPGFEDSEFVFKDTIASESSMSEDFNQDVNPTPLIQKTPDNSIYNQLMDAEDSNGGVSSEQFAMGPDRSESRSLSKTLVDISYKVDDAEAKSDNIARDDVDTSMSYRDVVASTPSKSQAKIPIENTKKRHGRENHIDPSAIIGSPDKRTTRNRGETPKVFQMSLRKAIQSEAGEAAIEAAKKELKQLVDLKTWVYLKSRNDASPSVHTRVTPCSMFLKEKFNSRGEFLLWKARLVDGGHRTDPTKYDPFEKSSPTSSLEAVYILLSIAVTENMEIESFDVPGAYLNASLQPGRFHMMSIDKNIARLLLMVDPSARQFRQEDGSLLVEIRRSLYGLPEASKLWYDYFTKALTLGGYTICPHDPCLFTRKRGSEISIIALYVDDCLHIWKGANIYRELYSALRNAKLPDLKVDKLEGTKSISFLGLNITRRQDRTLEVNQMGYLNNLLETDGGYKSFPATPCTEQLFKITDVIENESVAAIETTPFASLLMKTRYCERTRPELCLPLAVLQTKMRNPNENDNALLERVIAYLEGTKDKSMIVRKCDMKAYAYMDAAFAVHGNRVSHSGIHFTLGKYGNTILCKSLKQKTVATSSTEAELICIFDGLDYLIWIRNVLTFLGYPQGTTTIFQDNTSTITMAYMGRGSSGSKTRHIDIKYFYVKQFLDSKDLEIDHLGRDNMTADFFASPRQGTVFRRFRGMIMGEIL